MATASGDALVLATHTEGPLLSGVSATLMCVALRAKPNVEGRLRFDLSRLRKTSPSKQCVCVYGSRDSQPLGSSHFGSRRPRSSPGNTFVLAAWLSSHHRLSSTELCRLVGRCARPQRPLVATPLDGGCCRSLAVALDFRLLAQRPNHEIPCTVLGRPVGLCTVGYRTFPAGAPSLVLESRVAPPSSDVFRADSFRDTPTEAQMILRPTPRLRGATR